MTHAEIKQQARRYVVELLRDWAFMPVSLPLDERYVALPLEERMQFIAELRAVADHLEKSYRL